jgi:hypothetical protein
MCGRSAFYRRPDRLDRRSERGGEVNAPRFQLREVDDQGDRRLARALRVALDRGDPLVVGEAGGC